MNQSGQTSNSTSQAIEIAIRLGIIFMLAYFCLQILSPFVSLVIWGAIIAVAIYPLYEKLAERLGGKRKLAVTILAVAGIAIVLLPVISLSGSMADSAASIGHSIANGEANVPPPRESVKEWPVIGERAYGFWQQASTDLTAFMETYSDQLTGLGRKLLGFAASVGLGVIQFIISLIIAAAFLASSDTVNAYMRKFAHRLSGDHGVALLSLSEKTVRSVAVGVIGIAFIQAVLAGIGMLIAGVPAAGLLAIITLVLGIAQLPPLLVLIPVIIYLFSGDSMGIAIFFLVWSIMVAASDLVLKPLLLGRGVDAPMMVILLGAIGGMLVAGIVGLFIGAVVLAVGYKLLAAWVVMGDPEAAPEGGGETGT
jgi:predicted PurR-regulated permease PerM